MVKKRPGEGSGSFLQGLCTQDVLRRSGEVAALPAAFLSPKGKVLCDTIIKQQGNEYLVQTSRTKRSMSSEISYKLYI